MSKIKNLLKKIVIMNANLSDSARFRTDGIMTTIEYNRRKKEVQMSIKEIRKQIENLRLKKKRLKLLQEKLNAKS